jgi:hypothetical protein
MEEDMPSERTLAQKGYLTDMNELLAQDSTVAKDMFLDSYMDAMQQTDGKLYALSSGFYIRTLYGRTEYFGEKCGWGLQDFLNIGTQLSENVCLIASSPQDFLENILSCNIDSFVDWDNAACNFTDGRFAQLLTLCKAYADDGGAAPSSVQSGDALLDYAAIMKALNDDISANEGLTYIGYPGVPGNGAILGTNDAIAICSQSDKKDAAWEFIKMLFSTEYQMNCLGPFYPVTKEAFNETLENLQCGAEKKDVLLELVSGVQYRVLPNDPIVTIALEEASAYFAGDNPAENIADIVENRVQIYLAEQK